MTLQASGGGPAVSDVQCLFGMMQFVELPRVGEGVLRAVPPVVKEVVRQKR